MAVSFRPVHILNHLLGYSGCMESNIVSNVLRIAFGIIKNLIRFHDKYFETKGYRIHAAQMLKTLSSKVKKANVPASAYDT